MPDRNNPSRLATPPCACGAVVSAIAEPPVAPSAPATETLGAYARRWWSGVRGGDLGSLPIIVGLIVIAIIFQSQNSAFLTAGNFVNLDLSVRSPNEIVLQTYEIPLSAFSEVDPSFDPEQLAAIAVEVPRTSGGSIWLAEPALVR